MVYRYPAIFEKDEKDENYILVSFPDILAVGTFGTDYDDAVYMAKDYLKLMICDSPKQCLPPSDIEELKKKFPDKTIVMIEVEIDDGDLNWEIDEC